MNKETIVSEFYANVYTDYLYRGGAQQMGTAWASKLLESQFKNPQVKRTLEIGGGNGEHLKYVVNTPASQYISLDVRTPEISIDEISASSELKKVFHFKVGSVENLEFPDDYFDRVSGTCVLHHVGDPLLALSEIRRVATNGAEISFVLPTDPGIANRLIKKFITFRKLRKLSQYPPELFYALDHQNHAESLIQVFKYVFRDDDIKIKYYPFSIKSWNLNLLMTFRAVKCS